MQNINKTFVQFIANVAPYIAPIPSSFFVARSAVHHLEIPLIIGVVTGLVIETLGFSSVHTWLLLTDWNTKAKKTDAKAPANFALLLVIFYLIITVSLTVGLEIIPNWSLYTPALFPFLAIIGAVNLILVAQQEQREVDVKIVQQERSEKRRLSKNFPVQNDSTKASILGNLDTNLDLANEARKNNKYTLLERLEGVISEHPEKGVTELKNLLGVRSRSTVYAYIKELEAMGRVKKNQTINS